MRIVDRLQRALDSELGTVLTALVVIVVGLAIVYWILMLRQRKKDVMAYLYRNFYEKAEKLIKGFRFVGIHKAGFFGRQSPVQGNSNRSYGLCTIPPPELVDEEVCERFRCFSRAIYGRRLPLFSPVLWSYDQDLLVTIQGQLLHHDGRSLLGIKNYLIDQRLGKAYTEEILLQITKALAALHSLNDDNGQSLYHGFLLPRSLYLDFDVNRTVSKIVISDLGLPYSLGSEKLYDRITQLRSGKLPVERFVASQLLEELNMLAPEQKDLQNLHQVGPAVDFYSFGALAVLMFTHKNVTDIRVIEWNLIPVKWRSFIRACLSEDPIKRPKDFLEIEDWLTDPELALTIQQDEIVHDIDDEDENEEVGFDQLVGVLERVKEKKGSVGSSVQLTNSHAMEAGQKAMRLGRWKEAKEHFLKVEMMSQHE